MKHFVSLSLVVLLVAMAHGLVPDRKDPQGDSKKYYVNGIGMKFVWIPPGTFMMGTPKGVDPVLEVQHKVTITKGFYMAIYPVTQEEWTAIMGAHQFNCKGEKNLPAESVSWDQCQEFVRKLRAKDGRPYRLPTDAEWEYTCRAGTTTRYYCGDTLSTEQANFNGKGAVQDGKNNIDRKKTTPVGTFRPNPWGLYDMHGNVWQWCQDRHDRFSDEAVVDPQGPNVGAGRVMRSGCYMMDALNCRSDSRGAGLQDHGFHFCGLRICFFDE
jgi:formylglycine-generating enzyme required for sulfatase activity